jgi:DNA-binding response OmpR family regulator
MTANILVVDDNEENSTLLSKILELEGYQVIVAQDAMEAIRLVNVTRPDLAILDIMMPEMNGYELCKRMRQPPICLETPIVMLTAMSGEEERKMAMEAGANDIWSKPFDMDKLCEHIRALLG